MELYREIQGYKGLYEVSNYGNVRSLSRQTLGRWGKMKTSPGRVMKSSLTNAGYLRVDLCVNGSHKHYSVHRLVAQAFVPNPKNKRCVNHKNSNREDNRVENLEWVTYKENIDHAKVNGRLKPPTGIHSYNGKKTHCLEGHPLSGNNLYVPKTGYRTCKTCKVKRTRLARQELRNKANRKWGK